jgi:hypothetical protein
LLNKAQVARLLIIRSGDRCPAVERRLERSALVEAVTQLTQALDQIAALPPTPALRREEITLQLLK